MDDPPQEPHSSLTSTSQELSTPAVPPASLGISDVEASEPVKDIPLTIAAVEDVPPVEIPAKTEVSEPAAEIPSSSAEITATPEVPPPPVELPPEITVNDDEKEKVLLPVNVEVVGVNVTAEVEKLSNNESITTSEREEKEEKEKVASSTSVGAFDDAENMSLEGTLLDLCQEMQAMVTVAVSGYESSSEAVETHMNIMQKVLESNLTVKDESVWNEMFVAAQNKSEKDKSAEKMEKEAMAAIANVLESISAGRRNKVTSINPN